MKWDSQKWIFVCGKAFSGKTYFIHKHIEAMPPSRKIFIYDFTNEYSDLAKQKNVQVWQVKRGTQDEIEEFIGQVYRQGNATVVLSESDNYLAMNTPVLLAFVTTGRNRGLNAIIDAKRPKSVKPAYRGRFNKLIIFQDTLPDDQEYLEEWTGTGRGSLGEIRTLKQGEYLECDLDTDEVIRHDPI